MAWINPFCVGSYNHMFEPVVGQQLLFTFKQVVKLNVDWDQNPPETRSQRSESHTSGTMYFKRLTIWRLTCIQAEDLSCISSCYKIHLITVAHQTGCFVRFHLSCSHLADVSGCRGNVLSDKDGRPCRLSAKTAHVHLRRQWTTALDKYHTHTHTHVCTSI